MAVEVTLDQARQVRMAMERFLREGPHPAVVIDQCLRVVLEEVLNAAPAEQTAESWVEVHVVSEVCTDRRSS